MKSQKLFPFPLVNHNVEGLNARHHNRSGIIYRVVVCALIIAAASLPFITVDVSSRSRGIIRPDADNNQVTTATGGLITQSLIKENGAVCAGDTLLVLSKEEIDTRKNTISSQMEDNRASIYDLENLLRHLEQEDAPYPSLRTALYQKEYATFRQEMDQMGLKLAHAKRQYERQTELLASGAAAKMEQEQSRFEYELAQSGRQNLRHQKKQLWAQELKRYRRETNEVQGEINQLQQKARQFLVVAPIDGTINQVTGLQAGNYVSAGQTVATIAPDDALQVEVFVSPSDIGLIQAGQEVQLQIDAYHHNRWGMATGEVVEIASDIVEMGQQPVFVVKCTMDQQALHLKNGYQGNFKPGMSLTAHFLLTRRSLFDLLHDKMDDWLDPTAAPIASN